MCMKYIGSLKMSGKWIYKKVMLGCVLLIFTYSGWLLREHTLTSTIRYMVHTTPHTAAPSEDIANNLGAAASKEQIANNVRVQHMSNLGVQPMTNIVSTDKEPNSLAPNSRTDKQTEKTNAENVDDTPAIYTQIKNLASDNQNFKQFRDESPQQKDYPKIQNTPASIPHTQHTIPSTAHYIQNSTEVFQPSQIETPPNQLPANPTVNALIRNKYTKTCQRKTRVALLKVHKTGSSTLADIISRFGYYNNLTIALPLKSKIHFSRDSTLTTDNMRVVPRGGTPDILWHHVRYNHDAFKSLLPADMVYAASIRDPISWFLSAFLFFKIDKKMAEKLQTPDKPVEYYTNIYLKAPHLYRFKVNAYPTDVVQQIVLDLVAYDLGIPQPQLRNTTFIRHYIQNVLNPDIKIVLVNEYFDESLVLFKRYMCWGTKDVFYKRQMVSHKRRPETLPAEQVIILRKLAPSLFMIYDYFLMRFKQQINEQGDDFLEEAKSFKQMLQKFQDFCKSKKKGKNRVKRMEQAEQPKKKRKKRLKRMGQQNYVIMTSRWSGVINVTIDDCFHRGAFRRFNEIYNRK